MWIGGWTDEIARMQCKCNVMSRCLNGTFWVDVLDGDGVDGSGLRSGVLDGVPICVQIPK